MKLAVSISDAPGGFRHGEPAPRDRRRSSSAARSPTPTTCSKQAAPTYSQQATCAPSSAKRVAAAARRDGRPALARASHDALAGSADGNHLIPQPSSNLRSRRPPFVSLQHSAQFHSASCLARRAEADEDRQELPCLLDAHASATRVSTGARTLSSGSSLSSRLTAAPWAAGPRLGIGVLPRIQ